MGYRVKDMNSPLLNRPSPQTRFRGNESLDVGSLILGVVMGAMLAFGAVIVLWK